MLRALAIFITSLLFVPRAQAVVLDWSNVTWTAGSTSASFDIDPSSPGNDITLTFTGDTIKFTADPVSGLQTPAITASLEGGGLPGDLSLELATAMVPPDRITVTVTFSPLYTMGVEGVSFTLFDIDFEEKEDLIVSISALGTDGNTYAAAITDTGSAVSVTGVGLAQRIHGVTDSPDTGASSSNGNATIGFGPTTAIRSFTFTFDSTPGGPKLQKIAISDISFTPVPEVNPTLAAAALCLAGGIAKYSRRLRKRTPKSPANSVSNTGNGCWNG